MKALPLHSPLPGVFDIEKRQVLLYHLSFINIYKKRFKIRKNIAAITAVIGNVITHVTIIRFAVFQCTPLIRLAEPTPKIDEDTTCVVESGKCK